MIKCKKRFKPLFFTVLTLGFVAAVSFIFINQYLKSAEIEAERKQLTERYTQCLLEVQRLELMQKYIKTDEFLKYYVRDKYGLVDRNDILFYDSES
ncbi:MAG: hypothetical protein RRY79_07590 [Clostridia bacterium]